MKKLVMSILLMSGVFSLSACDSPMPPSYGDTQVSSDSEQNLREQNDENLGSDELPEDTFFPGDEALKNGEEIILDES